MESEVTDEAGEEGSREAGGGRDKETDIGSNQERQVMPEREEAGHRRWEMRHESREWEGGGERENVRGLMSPRSAGRGITVQRGDTWRPSHIPSLALLFSHIAPGMDMLADRRTTFRLTHLNDYWDCHEIRNRRSCFSQDEVQ